MAAEMPARVQPVSGATVVDFPWADATAAVTALNEAASTLGSQLEARATMKPSIVDWVGTYRDEFDRADGRLTSTATGLRESLAATASWIVGGAESANQQQRIYNHEAEQRPATTQPPPRRVTAGRRVPV